MGQTYIPVTCRIRMPMLTTRITEVSVSGSPAPSLASHLNYLTLLFSIWDPFRLLR